MHGTLARLTRHAAGNITRCEAAVAVDTTYYYRLTNAYQGPGFALDVKPDGSGNLMMVPSADYSGQYWLLVDLGGGRYALRTLYLGECFSLDVVNDGVNETPRLNGTGNFSGQSWSVTPWGDGTWKLTNDFTGADRSLNVRGGTFEPFVGPGNFSGQHWTLNRLTRIPLQSLVPELVVSPRPYHTEGPSNYVDFANPIGTIRAVMIFVDFPDAPGIPGTCWDHAMILLGTGKFQRLYNEQSYGKLSVEVDIKGDLGWRRLALSSQINLTDANQQRSYITAALDAFPDVNFGNYTFVIFVPPQGATGIMPSPGFNPLLANAVHTSHGDVFLGVTIGNDAWSNGYITLVHEVGHLFDLPDLSPTNVAPIMSLAGCWDIMCDIFNAKSFLGWHRRKNSWLGPFRTFWIDWNTSGWYMTVHPLSGGCGISMLALPIDNTGNPTKVFVIEVAQPSDPAWSEGMLIYTVDAKIASGQSPVVVLPKVTGVGPSPGPNKPNLFQAPFGVGDHADFTVDGVRLTVDVLQKFGGSYNIKIGYQRPTNFAEALMNALRSALGLLVGFVGAIFGLPRPIDRLPRAREPEIGAVGVTSAPPFA
jgi:M6 family metalloprotease-like protein